MENRQEQSGKRALMAAAADRIAARQQDVIEEFEASISEKIESSPTDTVQSVRDFLIDDD